jgi:hypothetical protein
MNDIRTVLRIAARRLEAATFLGVVNVTAVVVGALVLLLLAAERAGPGGIFPWAWLLPALVGAGLALATMAWSRRRPTEIQVALAVDERLELREKLSTALHCAKRDDPFACAAVEDAVAAARDPKMREMLVRRFAVRSPRRWWAGPLAVALAAGLWFVPPLDLFAAEPPAPGADLADTVTQRDQAITAVVQRIRENPKLSEELSRELGELTKEGTDPDALKTRQDIHRDAIKKLTDLNKKLDDIVNGEKGKTAESVEQALSQLKTPAEGPAKELAEAMARGDFKGAQEALAKIQKELQEGKLDDAQKQQLAEQMAGIAQQLEQLAQGQQDLEAALQQAGLNPELAKSPQALQQAIEQNQNLNEQQKQQLQQMAQAQQQAQQMCQGLGQACGQMAQGLMQQGQGQVGQAGPPGGQLGEQLTRLEQLQQLLSEAKAAQGACQGQCQGLGQGLALQQAMQAWRQGGAGGAFGNRGQGQGGKAPIAPTPTAGTSVKSPTKNTGGDIIAREFIDGPVTVGESRAQLQAVAEAVTEGYDEAQADEQIPPRYWEAHLHYFGELKKRVEAARPAGAAPKPASDPPASDAPKKDE